MFLLFNYEDNGDSRYETIKSFCFVIFFTLDVALRLP